MASQPDAASVAGGQPGDRLPGPGLREYLEGRGYTRYDATHAEAWELHREAPSPAILRVVLWPRTTRVGALSGPMEQSWTAEFGKDVPAALVEAFLQAAEGETAHG